MPHPPSIHSSEKGRLQDVPLKECSMVTPSIGVCFTFCWRSSPPPRILPAIEYSPTTAIKFSTSHSRRRVTTLELWGALPAGFITLFQHPPFISQDDVIKIAVVILPLPNMAGRFGLCSISPCPGTFCGSQSQGLVYVACGNSDSYLVAIVFLQFLSQSSSAGADRKASRDSN